LKTNLKTIKETLNDYLNQDPTTGLIPCTPMHKALNDFEDELKERINEIETLSIEVEVERINDIMAQNGITSLSKEEIEKTALENIESETVILRGKLLREILGEKE